MEPRLNDESNGDTATFAAGAKWQMLAYVTTQYKGLVLYINP